MLTLWCIWLCYLQLVNDYLLFRDEQDNQLAWTLHTVSCRLLLDIMPGLETTVIFQDNVSVYRYINQSTVNSDVTYVIYMPLTCITRTCSVLFMLHLNSGWPDWFHYFIILKSGKQICFGASEVFGENNLQTLLTVCDMWDVKFVICITWLLDFSLLWEIF